MAREGRISILFWKFKDKKNVGVDKHEVADDFGALLPIFYVESWLDRPMWSIRSGTDRVNFIRGPVNLRRFHCMNSAATTYRIATLFGSRHSRNFLVASY
jgi:hypothetical protein